MNLSVDFELLDEGNDKFVILIFQLLHERADLHRGALFKL